MKTKPKPGAGQKLSNGLHCCIGGAAIKRNAQAVRAGFMMFTRSSTNV